MKSRKQYRAMAVAPHALATQAGLDVLREGGNAIEATITIASVLAVVYPHMSGLGGDSFWLIAHPSRDIRALYGAGRTPQELDVEQLRAKWSTIPTRGPWAALTVAGTVQAWHDALQISRKEWEGRLPLARLLRDATDYAEDGYAVSNSQYQAGISKLSELQLQAGFSEVFLAQGKVPRAGTQQTQPALAHTLRRLANAGLPDFYQGELAKSIAEDLSAVGSPITARDLACQRTETWDPLYLQLPGIGRYYTTAPPTQGLATLCILGQFAQAYKQFVDPVSADYIHYLVEATKQAFVIRNQLVRDPGDMVGLDLGDLLSEQTMIRLATRIDASQAMPWNTDAGEADTTWFGVIDQEGRAVSCIQSLYHEFGSGVVLPQSGICWQNRGAAFSLNPASPRMLKPGCLPFHTLCPSLIEFDDGRCMVLGSMGGDGQPQSQSCVFTRYAYLNRSLEDAISLPRWVLGRTWGKDSRSLKLEGRFTDEVIMQLRGYGHEVEIVADFDEVMGHAGALVRDTHGYVEGAADPRSDGAALGFSRS